MQGRRLLRRWRLCGDQVREMEMDGLLAPSRPRAGQGLASELGVGPKALLNLEAGGREVSVAVTGVMGRRV